MNNIMRISSFQAAFSEQREKQRQGILSLSPTGSMTGESNHVVPPVPTFLTGVHSNDYTETQNDANDSCNNSLITSATRDVSSHLSHDNMISLSSVDSTRNQYSSLAVSVLDDSNQEAQQLIHQSKQR